VVGEHRRAGRDLRAKPAAEALRVDAEAPGELGRGHHVRSVGHLTSAPLVLRARRRPSATVPGPMGRFAHADRAPVDEVVDRWKQECLLEDGSLLFPGETLWTEENAQELVEHFNERQLEDERSFEEKLTTQLASTSRDAKRLMAEIVCAYFLFATNVGRYRKRELVSFVLGLADDEFPEDTDVERAFSTGIGSAGQAFNSYRPNLLIYLIDFTRRFKAVDDDERLELLSEAWRFRDWLVGENDQADGGEQMMRHILLHLLFVEEFERIASNEHKYRIADTFGGLVDGRPDEDIDRRLYAIRERIDELMPSGQPATGGLIDFYETPLHEAWDPNEEDATDDAGGISNLTALTQKRQVVLYGPPGTGKTHEAKDLARRLLRHQALVRWKAPGFLQNLGLIEDLADNQIRRLQLHQGYSYEDFIRGMRLGPDGATVPQDGYLLQLVDKLEASQEEPVPGLEPLPWVLILDEVNRVDLSRLLGEAFSCLEDREAEVDLPMLGEGGERRTLRLPKDLYVVATMNLIDQSVEQLDFALRRRFLWLQSGFKGHVIPNVVRQKWEAHPLSRHHPWERLETDVKRLAEHAARLNDHIRDSVLLGEQYEIGHTYFFDVAAFIAAWPRVRPRGQRPSGYLWRPSDGKPEPPLLDLWRHSLRPLLAEYLAGIEPQAARAELDRLRKAFLHGPQA
jgi:5-methylcytosine-specific restriction protein B